MRPPNPFTLRTRVEPQPESALEDFEQALNEFIEVIVRAEVDRLRKKSSAPEISPDNLSQC